MNTFIVLAVIAAIIGIALAVHFHGKAQEAAARQRESEAIVSDWLSANTMLSGAAHKSFSALHQIFRRW